MPSLKMLLTDVSRNLSEGISEILIWSVDLDYNEFLYRLYELLREYNFEIVRIDLDKIPENQITSTHLGNDLSISKELSVRPSDPPRVFVLTGFEEITPQSRNIIWRFYQNWRSKAHSTQIKSPLLILIPPVSLSEVDSKFLEKEQGEVKGRIRIVAGFPTALEAQIIRRRDMNNAFTPELQWKEIIISSICANDLELSDYLLDCDLTSTKSIQDSLQDYFVSKIQGTLDGKKLDDWKPIPRGITPHPKRHLLNLQLIYQKVTLYTPERGEEIHPITYLRLGKENGYLERLIWRGQSAVLMPIIDQIRTKIIDLLSKNSHFNHHQLDEAEIKDLCNFLKDEDNHSVFRQMYLSDLERVRQIRNLIAHLKPVSISDWNFLMRFSAQIQQQKSSLLE